MQIALCPVTTEPCAQVNSLAVYPSTHGHALMISTSGRLSLPHISTAELPDSARTAYLAVGVLMHYITGLQPETSSASADTHVQGKRICQLFMSTRA